MTLSREDDYQQTPEGDLDCHREINDRLRVAANQTTSCSDDLQYLAGAFRTTGNPTVSAQLYRIAENLDRIAENVRNANGMHAAQALRDAQAGSRNMIQAVIAVSRIDMRSEDQRAKPA
jgi:hypothetical protein